MCHFHVQILDTNPQLFFHLQQQRLIELIRNGKVEEALEFAQEELAPRGEENVISIYFCNYFNISPATKISILNLLVLHAFWSLYFKQIMCSKVF